MSDDSSASTSTIPPVVECARSTAEDQQAEDDTVELNNTELVNDPEEAAMVDAVRKKQADAGASRARRPQDPWRSRDLNTMDKIAAAFVAKFDKEKAKKAKKYVMVFVNVKGARNTVVQEQCQLAGDFRQFEEKEEKEARLEREKKAAQRAAEESAETDAPSKKSKAEAEEPVNQKDDYLLVFNESEYTKDFSFWLIVDDWVKDLCRQNSPDWWGRTMDDDEKWLRENYNPIYYGTVTKEGKENKYPQVRLKVAVNKKTGLPMFECKTESKKDLDDKPLILWRHSDHKETLEEWAKDDSVYFNKHGKKREATIPLKEMMKLMRRGAVVRFLWNFRGFGYAKSLNKVSNFGYVTKVTIVVEGTGTAPSTDFIED